MIKCVIILSGLLIAVAVGFFGVVRMRFAIGLVIACMMLNLFGCHIVHAATEMSSASSADMMQLWTASCPPHHYLTSKGMCEIAPGETIEAPQEEAPEWLRFSVNEAMSLCLCSWLLGIMLGTGLGILVVVRKRQV